jgi:hypothetical protein
MGKEASMTPRQRSCTGAALGLLAVPVVCGLMACLPVPVGDPERSRIDNDLSGVYADWTDAGSFTMFEPFDKRTWLVTELSIDWQPGANESCDEHAVPDSFAVFMAWLDAEGAGCLAGTNLQLYKAWRSRQGRGWFLTLEPKSLLVADEGTENVFDAGFWIVYRIEVQDEGGLSLRRVDADFDGFDGIKKTRRDFEKVIRRHIDSDALYDGKSRKLMRVGGRDIEIVAEFLEDLVDHDLG